MFLKLEGVLKFGAMGPELAEELARHVATRILVMSGQTEGFFPAPRLHQVDVEFLAGE